MEELEFPDGVVLDRISLDKYRLGITSKGNGKIRNYECGLSFFERVSIGEFPEFVRRSGALYKIESKYILRTGKGKFPQNLAYGLLLNHPNWFNRSILEYDYVPATVEEIVGDSITEERMFESLDLHRKELHRIGEGILESEIDFTRARKDLTKLLEHAQMADFLINNIIGRNTGFVASIFKIQKKGVYRLDFPELLSNGFFALGKAVKGFDSSARFRFSTYAYKSIFRESLKENRKRFRYQTFENVPFGNYIRLNNRADESREDEVELRLEIVRKIMDENLADLSDREVTVIKGRMGFVNGGEKKTLQEIGNTIGCSREHVRRIQIRDERKIKVTFDIEYINSGMSWD